MEFEKNVGLVGFEIQLSKFVDQKNVEPGQTPEQLALERSAREAYILIEQLLRFDKLSALAVLQDFEQQTTAQSRLAHAGGPR